MCVYTDESIYKSHKYTNICKRYVCEFRYFLDVILYFNKLEQVVIKKMLFANKHKLLVNRRIKFPIYIQ